jgi:hypothetical protein
MSTSRYGEKSATEFKGGAASATTKSEDIAGVVADLREAYASERTYS